MFRTPSVDDRYGLCFLSVSRYPSFDNYYASLDVLTPLLREPAWIHSCTGFYLSSVDFGFPRLTYFALDPEPPAAAVKTIRSCTGLIEPKEAQPLKSVEYAQNYGGSEIEFRQYLCTYTQIGLDLLGSDRLHSQRLFATYRWQVLPAGKPVRSHFESSFLRQSPTYQLLSRGARDRFWSCFEFWAGDAHTCWAHMFVNMVLAMDCDVPRPFTAQEINADLAAKGLDFDIPDRWKPE